jgi:acyl-CoA reductase-like NAD-dependent aldehyde dehydrogenase
MARKTFALSPENEGVERMAIVTPIDTPSGSRRRLRLASPATLETLCEIEVQTAEDVREAVERARKAQPGWAGRSFDERGRYMMRALEILIDRQDEFMDQILGETPKPRTQAILMDIFAACDSLHYYAKSAGKFLRPEKKRLHGMLAFMKQLRIVYQPVGVVGVISPWNLPFFLSINPTVQALMAGNAVLLKPSSATFLSGKLVGDLFEAAGLPDGVLTVLQGDGSTGAALIEAGVDKVCFTGSVATGRRVASACAERLIPYTLELGGKDPMIVCADANLESAAAGALAGAFLNAGQTCVGTERVYVVESVAETFTRKVVEGTARLRQETEGEFEVGAIYWPRQMEIIEEHIRDAISKGAKVEIGGRRNPKLKGLYYEPTVLTDVTHDMLVMREETFGPILPIMRVRDEEEAIRMANDTQYGLAANVWTRNNRKGFEIARRIHTGSVCVNDMAVTYGAHEAPFGGRKNSGIGQVNGEIGLKGYCHAQPILIDRFGGRQSLQSYPYSARKDRFFKGLIRFLWNTRLGRWLSIMRLPF